MDKQTLLSVVENRLTSWWCVELKTDQLDTYLVRNKGALGASSPGQCGEEDQTFPEHQLTLDSRLALWGLNRNPTTYGVPSSISRGWLHLGPREREALGRPVGNWRKEEAVWSSKRRSWEEPHWQTPQGTNGTLVPCAAALLRTVQFSQSQSRLV